MIEMTDEQAQAVAQAGEAEILDPKTHTAYVLVRKDLYERLKSLLAADDGPQTAYPLADEVFREDWDDPKMAEYDRYDEHKR